MSSQDDLNKKFDMYCGKVDKLMPLADPDMINALRRIVKREEESQIFAKLVNKWVSRLGKILGVLVALVAIIWYIVSLVSGQLRR
jgi:hypothetical protein